MLRGTDGDRGDARPPATTADGGPAAADLSSSYFAYGDPITANSTGVRYFWTNTLGTIFVDPLDSMAAKTSATRPCLRAAGRMTCNVLQ